MLFMLDYLMYADFMVIRDYNNYVYRVGYSVDVLSVRINSFPQNMQHSPIFWKGSMCIKRNLIWRIAHWIEHGIH